MNTHRVIICSGSSQKQLADVTGLGVGVVSEVNQVDWEREVGITDRHDLCRQVLLVSVVRE